MHCMIKSVTLLFVDKQQILFGLPEGGPYIVFTFTGSVRKVRNDVYIQWILSTAVTIWAKFCGCYRQVAALMR